MQRSAGRGNGLEHAQVQIFGYLQASGMSLKHALVLDDSNEKFTGEHREDVAARLIQVDPSKGFSESDRLRATRLLLT